MSDFFHSEHLGQTKFIFWYGQVLGDWECNENPEVHDRDDIPGWGKRYKVLIFGQDPYKIEKGLSNNEAVMAEVLLPVTAGTGIGGAYMTPQIAQNSFVMGFYKDGIDAREPVILGLVPNVPQTRLYEYNKNEEKERYYPATGYNPTINWHLISNENIFSDASGTSENIDVNVNYIRRHVQRADGTPPDYIPRPYYCDKAHGELRGVQKAIQDGLNLINRIKRETSNFQNAAASISSTVAQVINTMTTGATMLMKNIIQKIREFSLNAFNDAIKDVVNFIPPNLQPNLRITSEQATDTISCVFNKISGLLFNLIKDAFNKYILGGVNAGSCSVENVIGDVLSNVLGDITGAIQTGLNAISSITNKISNIVGKVTNALDIVASVLKFFSCEVTLKCPEIEEWSFWYGPKAALIKFDGQISAFIDQKINNKNSNSSSSGSGGGSGGCSSAQELCGPPTIQTISSSGSGFAGNPVISSSGEILAVDIINSGSGYGSKPIITVNDNCGLGNGAILVPIVKNPNASRNLYDNNPDITSGLSNQIGGDPSSNTGTTPIQNINNQTNVNNNSTNQPNNQPNNQSNNQTNNTTNQDYGNIIDLVVIDSGVGYISTPNGSTGGGGSKFSNPEDTIIFQNENNNYAPYPPNQTVDVDPGDQIYLPPGTRVDVFDNTGTPVQTIYGQGAITPIGIVTGGTITTPSYVGTGGNTIGTSTQSGISTILTRGGTATISTRTNQSTIDIVESIIELQNKCLGKTYSVTLELKDIFITNAGINYSPKDTITIEPSLGAILEPIFDSFGRLISVNIIKTGIGYTERPRIYINSTTGFNARVVPVFNVLRYCDLPEEKAKNIDQTKIINVIDCVGKI